MSVAIAGASSALLLAACSSGHGGRTTAASAPPVSVGRLALTSDDFADNGTIPMELTCQGSQRMPSLHWSGAPAETVELALTVEDQDAPGGPFVHWVVTGIPATATGLPAPAAIDNGWHGPCPPAGPAHHYVFTVYAVTRALGLPKGASAADVRDAAKGVTRGLGRLVGLYQRR
ncbi:MAG: hypothetical protein JWO37_3915 [Acidimicrobiales bacterium]|nr:hypothetical protein [Acidimicrobiales bacterium]